MLRGQDNYGAVKYRNAMFRSHPAGNAVGIMLTTFGSASAGLDLVEAILKDPKFALLRVQIDKFDRSHKYPIEKRLPIVQKLLKPLNQLALEYPGTPLLTSPFCEHTHSPRTMEKVFGEMRKVGKNVQLVNSPMKTGWVRRVWNESHGKNPEIAPFGPRILSGDGIGSDPKKPSAGCVDIDCEAWVKWALRKGVDVLLAWSNFNNLREKDENDSPKDRRNAPSAEELEMNDRLLLPKGPAPRVEGAQPLKPPSLWKICADDHENEELARENKPVLIIPKKVKKVIIETFDRKRVLELPYGAPYKEGGHLYRSEHLYGFQIGDIANQKSGSHWVVFNADGTRYGPQHAAHRGPTFR